MGRTGAWLQVGESVVWHQASDEGRVRFKMPLVYRWGFHGGRLIQESGVWQRGQATDINFKGTSPRMVLKP